MCIYILDKKSGLEAPDDLKRVKGLWRLDILAPEGEEGLREVVAHIKPMCSRLKTSKVGLIIVH